MNTTTIDPSSSGVHQRPNRIRLWLRRITFGAAVLLLAISALIGFAGIVAKRNLARQYPPPGERVELGGYQLHLNCIGDGSPTVILEAGLNDFSLLWSRVQPEIAKFTRVCSYDRAGLGWSDTSPHTRTSESMVAELHMLLTTAGVNGPYVLVGHSFGGINMRLFARHYAEDVVGLVLVDSSHEEQGARIPALQNGVDQMLSQFRFLSIINKFGLIALAPEQIPNPGLPEHALAQYRALLATTDFFDAAIAETETFYTALNARTLPLLPLGDLPLVVLSRGQDAPLPGASADEIKRQEEAWQIMQAELAALSSNHRQMIAEESGHYIQLQQPELVIGEIREMVQSTQVASRWSE